MHGNCSSRVEALTILKSVLPMGITVLCFDFSGSGKSGGDYISLGWYEREDLKAVVNHLRKSETVSTIGKFYSNLTYISRSLGKKHGSYNSYDACRSRPFNSWNDT